MDPLAAYVVGRRIGRGGLADVHAAVRRLDGAAVAVKLARGPRSTDACMQERFALEADRLRRAASPHVVGLLDSGIDSAGRPFLVLERATGGSLAARIGSATVSPTVLQRLVANLAAAVRSFHTADLHHHDIDPGNVLVMGTSDGSDELVGPDERLVLADPSFTFVPTSSTEPWVEYGKPGWRAPEVAAGTPAGASTDIHGATSVLWAAMTGAIPPDRSRRQAIVADMPRHWQQVFGPGFADDPDGRHRSIDEWAAAVSAAVDTDLEAVGA